MKIRLHIERLVVDAAIAGRMRPERIDAAVRGALHALLERRGIAPALVATGSIGLVRGTSALPPPAAGAAAVGNAIAGAVARTIGAPRGRNR
jgi:hypothetical protein